MFIGPKAIGFLLVLYASIGSNYGVIEITDLIPIFAIVVRAENVTEPVLLVNTKWSTSWRSDGFGGNVRVKNTILVYWGGVFGSFLDEIELLVILGSISIIVKVFGAPLKVSATIRKDLIIVRDGIGKKVRIINKLQYKK
jgi:hypothetical protein